MEREFFFKTLRQKYRRVDSNRGGKFEILLCLFKKLCYWKKTKLCFRSQILPTSQISGSALSLLSPPNWLSRPTPGLS